MNKEHESKVSNRVDDSCNDHEDKLLTTIQTALEDDSVSIASFVNEFNDFTIAIPLNGNQEALERFMEEQELDRDLSVLAKWLVSRIKVGSTRNIACCFTGRRPKKISWLSNEDDYRMRRLHCALRTLIKELALSGVKRFIAGNAEGFDTIAAEAVIDCNSEFETMKSIGVLSEDWEPIELEIAIPFEGHNAGNQRVSDVQKLATMAHVVSQNKSHTQSFFERNEYMVDRADLVIALLDSKDSESASGGTVRTIAYAEQHGKPVITLYARWFEDGWPNINGISVSLPSNWTEMLDMYEKQMRTAYEPAMFRRMLFDFSSLRFC